MTAIDFAAFVDQLAAVSGETIRPFFRTALGVENKSRSGGFDPVTAADRAAEAAMRALIKQDIPRARHSGRGIRRRAAGRGICLGARSDRRHQILHLRHAGLGHAHCADAARRTDLRHDAPAVHPRAFHRRRQRRELSRPGRRPGAAHPRLRRAEGGGAADDQPAADARRPIGNVSAASKGRCGCRATAATATPIACWPRARSTW